ncbi:exodeoxyribonuclease V subunit gamma [Neptunomonas sp. CHC150]|uniref:exodeoxyribonuclease V subunit gamma n=1 Tax=Neptunomonas sp. CHC150 TaxID=2998324 RepID=UPI0025B0BBCE|nr:exodeoxyribonuclease V subunit gamma [Neptunomonas sp. CHC150]MDN2661511.1 exodeoxyribonuclease V subunit gamma [Neptunomonas sp. CHC150]
MLYVYHSNALDHLRDLLVEMVKRSPLDDPFLPDQILVQSPGMAQWLKLELAEQLGIAANIEFPLPASFLWKVFVSVLDDVPKRSAYNKDSMTWVLMRILPNVIKDSGFEVLHSYLEQDSNPLRHYHLCVKIADLYDQYLVYRPDWIASWESGSSEPATGDDAWQPVLWRALVADTQARGLPHWHRANMYETFVKALSARTSDLAGIPPRIFVFGISALPQNYLEALVALGNTVDVHLMIANPCRHYWGDIIDPSYLAKLNRLWLGKGIDPESHHYDSGHPLLSSMGKLGRDYLHMIQQMSLEEVGLFGEPHYDSLLHAVQSDILELHNRTCASESDDFSFQSFAQDKSIQVHSNYSAMREVEVLQDQLLAMFEADDSLKPRDIIVMMPDVASYAPYIDAVFGNASEHAYLPYSISDRSADQEIPLIANFLSVISLNQSRFGAPEILDLLELPATLRCFDLSAAEFEQLRRWVDESGIHWGLDSQSREDLDGVSFHQNSWQFGMDRLFCGYAMGDVEDLWQSIAPYGGVTGISSAALGQLAAFLQVLSDVRLLFAQSLTANEWIEQVHALTHRLYVADERDQEALELIYKALESLRETISEVHYQAAIPAEVIQDYLKEHLGNQRSTQRFLSGQVNFCTLMPMRAIPFKVVCLLGMNDSDYPRALPPMGFDLMVEHPRKGDRSRRDDDRYLFLEAMLSARDILYISYVGRSIADNSPRVPSVLVSELLEYCDQAYGAASDSHITSGDLIKEITTVHPLTAYSASYFLPDESERLFSYNERWLSAHESSPVTSFLTRKLDPPELEVVELSDLIRFYRDPIRFFFERRLQIFFSTEADVLSEEEPFESAGLSNYLLRKQLLTASLNQNDLAKVGEFVTQTGLLPVGIAGQRELAQRIKDVSELHEKLQPFMTTSQPTRVEVDLNLQLTSQQSLTLQGWIDQSYPDHFLKFDVVKVSGKHVFASWIQHLATCAAGYDKPTYFRGLSDLVKLQPVPSAEAKEQLVRLLTTYVDGLCFPVSWLPDSGYFLLDLAGKGEEFVLKKAREKFESTQSGEWASLYVQRSYPEWAHFEPGLLKNQRALFDGMARYLELNQE